MTICRHLGVNFEEFVELMEEYVQIQKQRGLGSRLEYLGVLGLLDQCI
jgi:hypothetical protein